MLIFQPIFLNEISVKKGAEDAEPTHFHITTDRNLSLRAVSAVERYIIKLCNKISFTYNFHILSLSSLENLKHILFTTNHNFEAAYSNGFQNVFSGMYFTDELVACVTLSSPCSMFEETKFCTLRLTKILDIRVTTCKLITRS